MTLPRLLRGVEEVPMSYPEHHRVHGALPLGPGRRLALGDELRRAALRGRGGGGFPLADKLDAVRRSRGEPVVVVNGCEGEPMSVKDRLLLESLPHLVLDGAVVCAQAVGASGIVIAVEETSVQAIDALQRALDERPDLYEGLETSIVEVPPGYVSGQETAIVAFLNGGPAKPAYIEARITKRGVERRPTLMSNAETLAQAALIARHGATWFRKLGVPEEPGSALLTLGGAVRYPGVYEIEYGSSVRSLLSAAEGVTEPVQAYLFGGYAGTWVDARDASRARLSRAGLQPLGASLGAGIIVALPESSCPVAEVTRVGSWMAEQSSGQCGACVNGLGAIADALAAVAQGEADRDDLSQIRRWASQISGRGACAHPDGAARFVSSAVTVFAEAFADHARHGPCEACERRPVLFTPAVGNPVA
jgi:NADH:ubiquinone oxidoreductase subunit F (NADH-binding)